jgi:hypothetical protein
MSVRDIEDESCALKGTYIQPDAAATIHALQSTTMHPSIRAHGRDFKQHSNSQHLMTLVLLDTDLTPTIARQEHSPGITPSTIVDTFKSCLLQPTGQVAAVENSGYANFQHINISEELPIHEWVSASAIQETRHVRTCLR